MTNADIRVKTYHMGEVKRKSIQKQQKIGKTKIKSAKTTQQSLKIALIPISFFLR